jgi:hypothetical protein
LRVARFRASPASARSLPFRAACIYSSPTFLHRPPFSLPAFACRPLSRDAIRHPTHLFKFLFFFYSFKFVDFDFSVNRGSSFTVLDTEINSGKKRLAQIRLFPSAVTFPEDGPLKWSDLIKQIKEF